jgi:uncharacterized protein (DUF58 family)
MTNIPKHRHLDAATLAKLVGLQLRVQSVVEGTLAGLHRSPHHGSSIEFAEHKEYSPGDDIRHLDWKAYGKFDRYYIKRFEDETDLKAYFLLDCSGSMDYGDPLSKLEYGSILLASLAYFMSRQGDQPGLLAYAEQVRRYIPPRSGSTHMAEVLTALEKIHGSGGTSLTKAINYLTGIIGNRAWIAVISDMFDKSSDTLQLLHHLRARRHHIVLFHLLHPDEIDFPFHELTIFESMENRRRELVDPASIRKKYLAEMALFLAKTRQICLESEIEYQLISTREAIHEVLLRFLNHGRHQS